MLKLKLQYFGYLMQRTESLEKPLMLGKIESKRRREPQRMRWLYSEMDGETVETVSDFILGAPKSLQMMTTAMKLKDTYIQKRS